MTDLRSRLHDAVDGPDDLTPEARGASAVDDVLVEVLTARVRRRRAVRAGATASLGALAVTALAVGGAALTQGTGPVAPATGPGDDVGITLACGDVVPLETLQPERDGVVLSAPEVLSADPVEGRRVEAQVRVRLENTRDRGWDARQVVELAVLWQGEVVATGFVPIGEVDAEEVRARTDLVVLGSCDGARSLPAGEYDLVAAALLANADGSHAVGVSSGPVPFTVSPVSWEAHEAQAELDRLVAAAQEPASGSTVGSCGTRLPTDLASDVGVELLLEPTHPGGTLDGSRLTTRDGLTLSGEVPVTATRVVIARDGVVVGRASFDPEALAALALEAGEAVALPPIGDATLCRLPDAGGEPRPLPPGTYQVHAIVQSVGPLVEVVDPDGNAVGRPVTSFVTLVSDPVDVVVE